LNRRALIKPAPKAFAYFGHKNRHIDLYPTPRHNHIIEPFAGGAGYALRYADLQVTLYELDESVCMVWDYLINASAADIMALPLIEPYQSVNDLNICDAAKQLIGRWTNPMAGKFKALVPPCMSKYIEQGKPDARVWSLARKKLLSRTVQRIKHWKLINSSYMTAPNNKATWFIDPPYNSTVSRGVYQHDNRSIDYAELSEWCRNRAGQAIVCENTESKPWLPFRRLKTIKGGKDTVEGKKKLSTEVIWCSDERDWPMTQSSLL